MNNDYYIDIVDGYWVVKNGIAIFRVCKHDPMNEEGGRIAAGAIKMLLAAGDRPTVRSPLTLDLSDYMARLGVWSEATFGPGERTGTALAHVGKELQEIYQNPSDITEWADAFIILFDGVRRMGFSAAELALALEVKLDQNRQRNWPDWRTADPDKPIEHIRDSDQ